MSIQPPGSTNIVWHHATVTRARREAQNGHRGAIVWFTGLSGSGKSTLAHAVEETLYQQGCHTFVLDGDNVRHGLCQDLGFSSKDREEKGKSPSDKEQGLSGERQGPFRKGQELK